MPGMPVTPEMALVGTATSLRAGTPGTALCKTWVLLKRSKSPPVWAPSRDQATVCLRLASGKQG